MSLHRFYLPPDQWAHDLWLEGQEARHLVQVLRLAPGEEVLLLDGQGRSGRFAIAETAKKKARLVLLEEQTAPAPQSRAIMALAFSKAVRRGFFMEKAVELGGEWLYDTQLTGPAAEAAFARVLSQQKLNMEQQFIQQGNAYAAVRASAHYNVENAASERCSGVSYYRFLCDLLEKADWAGLGAKLETLRAQVLQHAQLTVSLHGSEQALDTLRTLLPGSRFAAQERDAAQPYAEPLTPPVNEAFIIDGGVNYAVQVWPMERRSDRKALARVMSYEYLWHNIREVGGAYGTGMLSSDGVEYLYTYRDPHVKESYDTFAKGPAELAAREYTEKDLNDFIVGTVAKLDTPRKPRAEARETDRRYFCGITDEMMAADRKALCAVDAALLKEQAAELGAAMANGVRVVFGSKDAVEAAKELFDTVETL